MPQKYFYCAFRYAGDPSTQYKFFYAPTMLDALARFTGRPVLSVSIEDITNVAVEEFDYYVGHYSL